MHAPRNDFDFSPPALREISLRVASVDYHIIQGSSAAFAWAQISDVSGASWDLAYLNYSGTTSFANSSSSYEYYSTPVRRVFFKNAGTHTFYLQANLWYGNSAGVAGTAMDPSWLQATYYPSSYGTVQTIAGVPGDDPSATTTTVTDPQTNEGRTAYLIDLSYYERKVEQARMAELEAENARFRAERELMEARLRQQVEADQR